MRLLERDGLLAQLQAQLDAAISGAGRLVFVEGEAGIGKTTLLRSLARAQLETLPVYWGSCDALATPRPLGALDDILGRAGSAAGTDRHRQFVAFLDLMTERSALVIIEDLHWADGATLDLLRYAGRRMQRTRSLLVASLRNDELVPTHPLRGVLGDLATTGVLRLAPAPLSLQAVQALCGDLEVDAAELHQRTSGNPFFVTEVLAAAPASQLNVPPSVADAVLARAARLSPAARAVLNVVAVAGPRVDAALLRALAAHDAEALSECLATGVLRAAGPDVSFRHELARLAIYGAMTPVQAVALHQRCLQALQAAGAPRADAARLVHHAAGAQDAAALRQLAPLAAQEAARRGAHREAAAHWRLAAEHAATAAERAQGLEQHSAQVQMVGELDQAIAARREAVKLWTEAGEPAPAAMSMSRLALLLVMAGRSAEGELALEQAQALLPAGPPSDASWLVQRAAAGLRMLVQDSAEAIRLVTPVLAEAERRQDRPGIVHALVTLGSAQLAADRVEDGMLALGRALSVAESVGDDQLLGLVLANYGSGCAEMLRLPAADVLLQRGIAFCGERDLDAQRLYQLSWLANVRLLQGRWDDAGAAAEEVIGERRAAPIATIMALIALGRLRARRGEAAAAWAALDRASELAAGAAALQRLAPVHAARAEAAWLEGRPDDAAREAGAALPLALAKRHARHAAELVMWCRRAGQDVTLPGYCEAQVHAAEAVGDWSTAAGAWAALSCRYEQARCLADGDAAAQREALAIFQSLGAVPMAERVARQLRASGVAGLPRGPRASTQRNEAGLTTKELAVLQLLATGLRSKDIGARLSRSPRTVDHHLQAIFAKLGVSTRAEAVSAAYRLGVVRAGAVSRQGGG
jgi:DNA-binding CsgD family transcriptional regulator/tetratricopeptide (TPR) repeat protein